MYEPPTKRGLLIGLALVAAFLAFAYYLKTLPPAPPKAPPLWIVERHHSEFGGQWESSEQTDTAAGPFEFETACMNARDRLRFGDRSGDIYECVLR